MQKKIEKVKEAVKKSDEIEDMKKSLILEKIEEWRHEDEAMSLIPEKLIELASEIKPILKEIGLI